MGRPARRGRTADRQAGPDAASVRAVADAVGTTTGGVYSLFGSKQGLLEALASRLFGC